MVLKSYPAGARSPKTPQIHRDCRRNNGNGYRLVGGSGHYKNSSGRGVRCFQPAVRAAFLIYVSTMIVFSEVDPSPAKRHTSELEEMKIQVTKLESLLEEKGQFLDSRVLELEKCKKMIVEMDKKINFLHEALNDVKVLYGGSSILNENVSTMDKKVQQLWGKSRRNKFNIHVSESKTCETEKKAEEVASKVEKMQNIINEQWIQIQQLEQSLQMIKVMTSRVNKKLKSDGEKKRKSYGYPMSWLRRSIARHSYLKPLELPDSFFLGGSLPKSSLLKATNKFKKVISTARKKHHELQYAVKQIMEMNVYTASFTHREFIFFVASMIAVLPLMTAWLLLYPACIL